MLNSWSVLFAVALAWTVAGDSRGADWPCGRADAARSGWTAEPLGVELSLRWTAVESHPPAPAWPSLKRMPFDRACQVVVAGGRVLYGTSADDKVVARDAATGKTLWTTFADAPVRFAPAVWRDRVFVVSDDGLLYCLDAADGRVRWKFRGGPRNELVLGNGRAISRWPARGGPVVADNLVYFGAGIWPTEGIFLYALNAATGQVVWCNDSSGGMEMDQPHGGARAVSGASAQGDLVVAGDALIVPTGRAVPAVFNRADGTFRYFHLQANRAAGGSEAAAFDQFFVNGGTLFATADGRLQQVLGTPSRGPSPRITHSYTAGVQIAAHPKWIVCAKDSALFALDRQRLLVESEVLDRKGAKKTVRVLGKPAWEVELPGGAATSLIAAGEWAIAGGAGVVTARDIATGKMRWQASVSGTVYALAVAEGRLLASTDRGRIYCFGSGDAPPVEWAAKPAAVASGEGPFAQAADEIVQRTGVTQGYCLDLACGDGQLALELARRTELQICAFDADPTQVAAARQLLDAAGVYGVRVTVHQADPAALPYPDSVADLVVSGRSVLAGADAAAARGLADLPRPDGGIMCLGRPGELQSSARGPLPGAGKWTHQYGGPANTVCSGDTRLKGPLQMRWFRDTDLLMPSRHGRGPAPLVADGRMFVAGLDALRAASIYNGTVLWEIPLPSLLAAYHQDHLTGVAATGSNLCLGGDRLFLHTGDRCLVLDVKTGSQIAEFPAPAAPGGQPGRWGYIAWQDGILFGSTADERHVVTESWNAYRGKLDMTGLLSESSQLFALDPQTGRRLWSFTPQHSIRHNTIALEPGRVYLIDRPLAAGDRPASDPAQAATAHPTGRLVCLDARTGEVLWENARDIFGTLLAVSQPQGVLVMSYQATRFSLASERGGRLAGFRTADGARLWDSESKYRSRPVLIGDAIYAEPEKFDVRTGKVLPFEFARSYGCGILAGSQRLLVYRSATLGYYDLEGSQKTENYGGIRPGCWINAIPAGGLVLLADAASWCTCSYLNQATIALEPIPMAGE
ncbi:MAG: PQQ-binding-like beta-propeller repeat protein [Candidatus Anammoximicrobium sp.]|nr:PQQ-binding-like beta-propeller repeat protein [Candidatus Anammoximicrobium sp.]